MKNTFESSLERLEAVVKQLESGEMPLDESLKLFEEGTKLIKECNNKLDKAEQKVMILSSTLSEPPQTTPFTGENN